VPTGAGTASRIPTAPLAELGMATWIPGARSALVSGSEKGQRPRLWRVELDGGAPPRPVTPENTLIAMSSKPVSPDGSLAAALWKGSAHLFPIAGGEPRAVPGAAPREEPVRFGADGRTLYTRVRGVPTRIYRVDLATGARELWKEIVPADPAGVRRIQSVVLTPDGSTYAYTFQRVLSQLYEADLGR